MEHGTPWAVSRWGPLYFGEHYPWRTSRPQTWGGKWSRPPARRVGREQSESRPSQRHALQFTKRTVSCLWGHEGRGQGGGRGREGTAGTNGPPTTGKNPTDEYLEGMMSEAPGPINFTMFLTMFGEKLNGTDPEDVIDHQTGSFMHQNGSLDN